MAADLSKRIELLAQWLYESEYTVVFTGAGISTESGLRDFRGPDGVWTRRDKGLSTPRQDFSGAQPNSGHEAIADFQKLGRLKFLISQNVDNLHLKSGINPEIIAELHGNLTKVRCEECQFKMDRMEGERECPLCGGNLVSTVVDFGMSLPEKDLMRDFVGKPEDGIVRAFAKVRSFRCRWLQPGGISRGGHAQGSVAGRGKVGDYQPGRNAL